MCGVGVGGAVISAKNVTVQYVCGLGVTEDYPISVLTLNDAGVIHTGVISLLVRALEQPAGVHLRTGERRESTRGISRVLARAGRGSEWKHV